MAGFLPERYHAILPSTMDNDLRQFFITPQGFSDDDLRALERQRDTAWSGEGQLAVDVYQTDKEIIVESAVAGIDPKDLDISVNNEILTIKGRRQRSAFVRDEDYFCRECYWGEFSRSVALPEEVLHDKIKATYKNGVLTVALPKARPPRSVNVKIQ